MQATSERKNISLRDEDYYRLLLDVYKDVNKGEEK